MVFDMQSGYALDGFVVVDPEEKEMDQQEEEEEGLWDFQVYEEEEE